MPVVKKSLGVAACAIMEVLFGFWIIGIHNHSHRPFGYEMGAFGVLFGLLILTLAILGFVTLGMFSSTLFLMVIGGALLKMILFTFFTMFVLLEKSLKKVVGFLFLDFFLLVTEILMIILTHGRMRDAAVRQRARTQRPMYPPTHSPRLQIAKSGVHGGYDHGGFANPTFSGHGFGPPPNSHQLQPPFHHGPVSYPSSHSPTGGHPSPQHGLLALAGPPSRPSPPPQLGPPHRTGVPHVVTVTTTEYW